MGMAMVGDWAVRFNARVDNVGREKLDMRDSSLLAYGSGEDTGGWELHIDPTDDLEIHYSGFRTLHSHNLAEVVQNAYGSHATQVGLLQPDASANSPNTLAFQISAKFPVRADIGFVSETGLQSSRAAERVKNITGKQLSNTLIEKQKQFDEKFNRFFNLTDKVSCGAVTVGRW
ncbi:mannosyl-oligosaccharide glucosidase GCS1-like [Papaver somniferum]|uniref:mannosyl-oligosaccharide glucosidase GCS1-like n=1 Tax=Papaver somniferum TaxID=3469 RepID=UPI000E6FC2ED|nr:mannosyl-oligosaccharide glucosidase GCS1-like [Papaver somniferum]